MFYDDDNACGRREAGTQRATTNAVPGRSKSEVLGRKVGRLNGRKCALCKKPCQKHRELPCGHDFCKRCLEFYFESLGTNTLKSVYNYFKCPQCGKDIENPALPRSKWTKQFKMDKRTKFYSSPSGLSDVMVSSNVEIRSPDARLQRTSTHRTAIYARLHESAGFNSRIDSDAGCCQYWSGTSLPGGELVLADWLNSTVKVFNTHGRYIHHLKLPSQPLDLTYLCEDIMLVSLGSRSDNMIFLKVTGAPQATVKIISNTHLHGTFLYHTTRFERQWLGVFEESGDKVYVAVMETKLTSMQKINITMAKTDTSRVLALPSGINLTSNTYIHYCPALKRIFLAERSDLYCLTPAGELVFTQSFKQSNQEKFLLGAITSDATGGVYVTTQSNIICLNAAGERIDLIQTSFEPFDIHSANNKLFVMGRSDTVNVIDQSTE